MDRFKLKILMVIFMLLNNIAVFFTGAPFWFNYVGRVVMPIFFYLLVEGYFKTSSKNNYLKRLLVAAEGMFLGNIIISIGMLKGINGESLSYGDFKPLSYLIVIGTIILSVALIVITIKQKIISDKKAIIFTFLMIIGKLLLNYGFDSKVYIISNNIFLSMVAAFIMLNGMVQFRTKNFKVAFVKVLVAASIGIFTESLIIGPALTFIFYKCFNNRRDMYLAIVVFSALFLAGFNVESLLNYPQWMMVFSIPLIMIYNGNKGKDLRWFFYIFYPVHIWLLFLLTNFIK